MFVWEMSCEKGSEATAVAHNCTMGDGAKAIAGLRVGEGSVSLVSVTCLCQEYDGSGQSAVIRFDLPVRESSGVTLGNPLYVDPPDFNPAGWQLEPVVNGGIVELMATGESSGMVCWYLTMHVSQLRRCLMQHVTMGG